MTMAIASQPSALAFGSYEECRNVFGPIPFCLNLLDFDESSDNSADSSTGDESGQSISAEGSDEISESPDNSANSPTGDELGQSISAEGSDEISESPDNSANSPTGDELGQSISGVGSGDGAEMVSVPEPSLILGLITLGGFMLGSRKKAKA
jgi:hypothetical protein